MELTITSRKLLKYEKKKYDETIIDEAARQIAMHLWNKMVTKMVGKKGIAMRMKSTV